MQLSRILFKDRSLWYKFTLISVLPVIIVTATVVWKVVGSVERATIAEAHLKADELTDLTRLSMSHASVFYNKNLLNNFVDVLGRIQNVPYALVWDSQDGLILAHIDHRLDGKPVDRPKDPNHSLRMREHNDRAEAAGDPNFYSKSKRAFPGASKAPGLGCPFAKSWSGCWVVRSGRIARAAILAPPLPLLCRWTGDY